MIDIDALQKALEGWRTGNYSHMEASQAHELMYDAARLVLAAVPAKDAVEAAARAIYECEPYYEDGEYIDGLTVSPGGPLTWEQAVTRDAEFADVDCMIPITKTPYEMARAALIAAGVHGRAHDQDADLWSPPSHGPGDDVAREQVQRERDAFRAGAEAMRETCAKVSFALLASDADIPEHYGSEIAARIRALPIPLPGGQTS